MEGFVACFSDLVDTPDDNALHAPHEILLIVFCTILCGGEDCSDMALFGRAKAPFLRSFCGSVWHPSHDTFSRLFRLLDPARFQACLLRIMPRFAAIARGVVAIDGKTPRRSFDDVARKSPLASVPLPRRFWRKAAIMCSARQRQSISEPSAAAAAGLADGRLSTGGIM